jgi:fumarylacetoacetate (FAA) hydrolase
MKLATYKDGSRDGQLVVVSRDLSIAHYATGMANQLQQVLDDWNFISPQLQDLSDTLNFGKARHAFAFDPHQCMAPLPRAYQRVGSAAFTHALGVMHQAGSSQVPAPSATEPLLYQGSSDDLRGACDDIVCASEALGIDFEAELAVVTGDIHQGATPAQALDGVRLVMLGNTVHLRNLMATELARGWGALQSRPASAFSPVAVTLDELVFGADNAWQQGRVHLTLQTTWNGRKVGLCEAGPEMTFHFGQLLAHLAKTRAVRAGSIVSSGAVSNQDPSHGYSCIAEKRALETLQDGKPMTDYMKHGDTLRLEMRGRDGLSVFGAIEQEVVPPADRLTPPPFA